MPRTVWALCINRHCAWTNMSMILTSAGSRIEPLQNTVIVLWFWYDSDMISCYDLLVARFCSYDFDMVSVTVWFWYGFSCDFWWGSKLWCVFFWCFGCFFESVLNTRRSESYQKHFGIISRLYQNQPYQNHAKPKQPWGKRPKACPRVVSCFFFRASPSETPKKNDSLPQTIFKSYQNHIKILSQSYQNHIKFISKPLKKRARNRPKACPLGCFCFLFPNQPIRSPEQAAPFPNHIKVISKTISKS